MVSSTHRTFLLTAALAVGWIAFPLIPESMPPITYEPFLRQLQALSSRTNPSMWRHRTVQLRSGPAAANDPRNARLRVRADASSLWWEDLKYESNVTCGRFKCFFLSASDPAEGYLIVDWRHENSLGDIYQEYNYARELESRHGVRHFLSGPPYKSKIPVDFVERLDDRSKERYLGGRLVVVQESHAAPEGSRIFKCDRRRSTRWVYDTLDYIIGHGSEGCGQRLLGELPFASLLLESHPGLANDFQVMIDLEGRIYHLDFDRALKGPQEHGLYEKLASSTKICLDDAIAYVTKSINESSISLV